MSRSKLEKRKQDICERIGQFYLNEHARDYDKAAKAIEDLQITDIEVTCGNTIIIKLSRVGLFFGVKGRNITDLESWLGLKIHVIEVEHINNWVIPQRPELIEDWPDYSDYHPLEPWVDPDAERDF